MSRTSAFSTALRRFWRLLRGGAAARQPARKPAAAPARGAAAASADDERRMQAALGKVLDAHPRSRKVFRHLALVERTLRKYRPEALKALPPKVLATALKQLETLVDDWSAPGLTALRRVLSVEALDSTQPNIAASTGMHPSDFHAASRLQVSEASVSEFMRAGGRKTRV